MTMTVFGKGKTNFMYGDKNTYNHDTSLEGRSQLHTHTTMTKKFQNDQSGREMAMTVSWKERQKSCTVF